MMSVHDALEAWQLGEITTARAMSLSGASDILELYGLAEACGVDLQLDLRDEELAAARTVSAAVERAISRTDPKRPSSTPSGMKAA